VKRHRVTLSQIEKNDMRNHPTSYDTVKENLEMTKQQLSSSGDITFNESDKDAIAKPISKNCVFEGNQWQDKREGARQKKEGLESLGRHFWRASFQLTALVQGQTKEAFSSKH